MQFCHLDKIETTIKCLSAFIIQETPVYSQFISIAQFVGHPYLPLVCQV